jgi:hypothetical protein
MPSYPQRVRRVVLALIALTAVAGAVAASTPARRPPGEEPGRGRGKPPPASGAIAISGVTDASRDRTAQNETPIAVNPANPLNLVVGSNDWNPNDGCAFNASADGGKTWTRTVPDGFLPGLTRFTNDPDEAGTGAYDAAGDPSVGFSPDGASAYYACLAYNLAPPFDGAVFVSRSRDGGFSWESPTRVSTFTGNGVARGSPGQAVDHQSLHVDPTNGYVYVTWAQFNGPSLSSPVFVAVSRDGGDSWSAVKVTSGPVRSNQDQRVVTDGSGNAYLVFDNGVQGGKGTALYVAKSTDGGLTWSQPVEFAELTNPVCMYPPSCFNVAGAPFRAGGTYPAPAYDLARDRLDVAIADLRGAIAQVYLYSLTPDLTLDFETQVTSCTGDCFEAELSTAPDGRLDLSFYDRSYSGNRLVDLTYATSSDGGRAWRQARVTPKGFDPADWGVPGDGSPRPFIGDYNGIASTPTSALMAWTGVANPRPYNLEVEFAAATP